ncbi:MAG: DUF2125 domain-containing protein [Roseobacter sp.]
MSRLMRHFLTSSAIALCATTAFAELSADDVWNDWETYTEGFGYDVDGTQTRQGNVLTITGVTISSGEDAAPGGASVAIDRIVLTDQSDGTVTVEFPAIIPIEATTPNDTGGLTRVSLDYRQSGMSVVASGTPDAINYVYSADTVTLGTTGFEVNGQAMPEDTSDVEITINDINGTSTTTLDNLRRYTQSMNAGSMRYVMKATDPTTGAVSDVSGQIQQLAFNGDGAVPLRDIDSDDFDAMLAAGFSADGMFNYAANALTATVKDAQNPVETSVLSGPGSLGVTMNSQGLTYDVAQTGLQVDMTSPALPVPVSFNMDSASFKLAVPVRQSEEPDDFAFGFSLDGFTMSDMLWGMFDPGNQLPRDPASIALDLAGKAKLMVNFLDPNTVAGLGPDTAPAEVENLDINKLQITAAGAELTGDGGFTFDNNQGPMPQPQGTVDLTLTGGNGLIDKLVAGGLIKDQDAMGVRMMMGLLAVPGDGPDTLNSKIEINDQGHVLANGQRIQ